MNVFVDTSGVLAMLDASDAGHARAAGAWKKLLESGAALVTTSYVLVETLALAQHRLAIAAVRDIDRTLVPLMRVVWIDAAFHARGMAALLAASRRKLSLVGGKVGARSGKPTILYNRGRLVDFPDLAPTIQ